MLVPLVIAALLSAAPLSAAPRSPVVPMMTIALERFQEFQSLAVSGARSDDAGRAPASSGFSELGNSVSCSSQEGGRELSRDFLSVERDTYNYLRRLTDGLSGRECLQVLHWELNRPGMLWSELTEAERADRIYAHAKRTFRLLKEIQKQTGNLKSLGSLQRDIYNADYLDPVLSPELITCIALQETKGFSSLSPHAVNYTFCQSPGRGKYASSASGLGQVTWTTMSGVSAVQVRPDEAPVELLPIKTVPRHEGKPADQLFEAMNDDVPLQMEIVYRIMNYKLKFARFKSPELGANRGPALVSAGVASYDRDNESAYLKNVVS
ncbi:MAG: hypothetical protein RJB38_484, partial [Pseudomonadota bacterium]